MTPTAPAFSTAPGHMPRSARLCRRMPHNWQPETLRGMPLTARDIERAAGLRPGVVGRRYVGGVCSGLACHLNMPVVPLRALMLLAVSLGGSGVILYLLWWLLLPCGDPLSTPYAAPPRSGLSRGLVRMRMDVEERRLTVVETLGVSLLVLACGAAIWTLGLIPSHLVNSSDTPRLVSVLIMLVGAALAWSARTPAAAFGSDAGEDADQQGDVTIRLDQWLRAGGGIVCAGMGLIMLMSWGSGPRHMLELAAAGLSLLGVALLIGGPLAVGLYRRLQRAQVAREREAERADMAAHLHDSVLQTLTLIRQQAHDPQAVARLARAEERSLRAWLYSDHSAGPQSVCDTLRELCATIEDRYAVPIEAVIVGTCEPLDWSDAIIAATGEALSNAVRHGEPPVSLYAEISTDAIEVYVRDRGPGFDPDAIDADRHGVRSSIIGRMERHGGYAEIRRRDVGTDIHLHLPAPTASTPLTP